MAKKKANKKVEKVKEELIDEEDIIDLEDYEDDLDEEFLDDEEEEFEPKKKVKKVVDEPLTLEERVEVMEKKLNVVMILSIIITIIAVITMFIVIFKGTSKKEDTKTTTDNKETETQTQSYEYDISKFKEISASEVENESKNQTILLYIGRSTCGYCIQYVPVLQAVQEKHSYTTYYLDIAKIYDYQNGIVLDSSAEKVMLGLKTNDAQKGVMDNFGSTPMTLVIKNGKIVDSIIGYVDEATLEKLVNDNGLK